MKQIKIIKITIFFLLIGNFLNINKINAKQTSYEVLYEFAYRTRPTESMETGTPRADSSNDYKNEIFEQSDIDYPAKKNKKLKDDPQYYEDTYYDSIPSDEEIDLDEVLEKSSGLKVQQRYVGHFKIGNPYKIFGVSYIPQDYESFEEEGTASWYGSEFHGKKTANGEIYNMGDITAAHPTLPLPSLIKITNLKNNKSATVRVNDRGPFAKNRIIDVSEKTAEILGFKNNGTSKVKIQFLRNETDEMLAKLGIGSKKNKINNQNINQPIDDKELELYTE